MTYPTRYRPANPLRAAQHGSRLRPRLLGSPGSTWRLRAPSRHRKPDPQLALRGAAAPFPVRRRGHHQRDRRGPAHQLLLRPDRPAQEEGRQAARLRHRVDAGPHRGEQAHQPDPRPRGALAAGRLRRASRRPPPGCSTTGPTPTASGSSSSARSRRWRPPSTSPRWPASTATPGSRTSSARPTTRRTPACRASPFKMATGSRQDRRHGHAHRLAGAQQAAPTRRTPASPTPS